MVSQQERWQLGGSAADVYQQHLVPAIFGPWAPVVVEAAGLRPGERVLDAACGTGAVAREAARSVGDSGSVVGLDNNPGMLSVARGVTQSLGLPIKWHEADAATMPFADATFGAVLCQLGLQYFPDRLATLREMRRVLVPGGRLVLLVWQSIEHSPGFAVLAEALERHVGESAAAIMRAPFALGDQHEVWRLIADAGFQGPSVRGVVGKVRFRSAAEFVRYQVAGSPLAAPVGAATRTAQEALAREVEMALRAHTGGEGLVFPIGANLAIGRA